MQTQAVVIALDGDFAVVETSRKSACDGCHRQQDGKGCAMCTLMGDSKTMRARAHNPLGAQPGDTVLVESSSARVLGYGALVFLLPLLAALAGWGIAALLTAPEAVRGVAAAVGFGLAFAFLSVYSRRVIAHRYDVTVVQILHHD